MITTSSRKTKILDCQIFSSDLEDLETDFSEKQASVSNIKQNNSISSKESLEDDENFLKRAQMLLDQLKSSSKSSSIRSSKSRIAPYHRNSLEKKLQIQETSNPQQQYDDLLPQESEIIPQKIEKLKVFHETQQSLFCGKHAINNLFEIFFLISNFAIFNSIILFNFPKFQKSLQNPFASVKKMDSIANKLYKEEQNLFLLTENESDVGKKKQKPKFSIKIKNRHKTKQFFLFVAL